MMDFPSGLRADERLLQAIYWGDTNSVRRLLDNGASPYSDEYDLDDGDSPIHSAAELGHVEILRLLLVNGEYVDALDYHGCTPLYLAAKNNHLAAVKLLLDRGADAKLVSDPPVEGDPDDEQSPLGAAIQEGHLEILRAMLDHGIDVNPSRGNTLLHEAAY